MKTLLISILFVTCFSVSFAVDRDSLGRKVAQIINQERARIGVDTLNYEPDAFCFATDWADSTDRYFNAENNEFSRKAAHRNFKYRFQGYENDRNMKWRYYGECIATGSISFNDNFDLVADYANALLKSEDHYKVLTNSKYQKLIVGIVINESSFSMVVFTTAEYK